MSIETEVRDRTHLIIKASFLVADDEEEDEVGPLIVIDYAAYSPMTRVEKRRWGGILYIKEEGTRRIATIHFSKMGKLKIREVPDRIIFLVKARPQPVSEIASFG